MFSHGFMLYDFYLIESYYFSLVLAILLVQRFHTNLKNLFNTICRQYRETFAKFMIF